MRKHSLGAVRSQDLSDCTTAKERLELMWVLAIEAWSLSGKPIPRFPRGEAHVEHLPRSISEKP